jgi:proteic killer suppression protein
MIGSFRHKVLKRLYDTGDRSKLPSTMVDRIEDILALLDVATEPADLDRPTLRLHPLKDNLQGSWAVTVRANWRITFRFEGDSAFDIDFVDYH